jgi:DNA repair protein RadC
MSDRKVGHRQRLKKKFKETGLLSLHDYEVIELLLTYALPRSDVKAIAKKLIEHFGSFSGILDASIKELTAIKGISEHTAILLKLSKDISTVYLEEQIVSEDVMNNPITVSKFARMYLGGEAKEYLMVIFLNAKNKKIANEILHEGTINQAIVFPREIIKKILEYDATAIILVHNHASGETKPSSQDLRLTQNINDAVKTIDVTLLDHLIVTREGYFSFVEHNLIDAPR